MSDFDALVAAVYAKPDEDTPRLALADWLDEHATSEADRARGEFVRLSFELDNTDPNAHGAYERQSRLWELLRAHGPKWFAPLPRYANTYDVRRGFVHSVTLKAQQISQWDRHARWCPTIRELQLRHCRRRVAPVASAERTAQLHTLDVGGCDVADLEVLAACSRLGGLKVFKVHLVTVDHLLALLASPVIPFRRVLLAWYGNSMNGSPEVSDGATLWATSFSMRWNYDDLPRLWASPHWARVRELWLSERQSPNQGFADPFGYLLENAPHFTGVRELRISGNAQDDEQMERLARCPSLGGLEVLHAANNAIGDAGAASIVARWPRVRELHLGGNQIGSAGASALAHGLVRAEVLDLRQNQVFLPGMAALAGAPNLRTLTKLMLDNNPGDALGGPLLAASEHLRPGALELKSASGINSDAVIAELENVPEAAQATVLRFDGAGVTDAGLSALARCEHLTNVTELSLRFCSVSKKGLDALAKWPGLAALRTFDFMTSVNYRCCRGADFDKLLRSKHWGALEQFKIEAGHHLQDAGAVALAASKFAPTLRELSLTFHGVTDVGAAALAGAHFAELRALELGWDSTIGTAGVVALAGAVWPKLERFGSGNLTDAGLNAIAASTGFARLVRLTVSGNELTDAAARALARAAFFSNLVSLTFGGDELTDAAVLALTAGAPKLEHLELWSPQFTSKAVECVAQWPALACASEVVFGRFCIDEPAARALANAPFGALQRLWLREGVTGDAALLALAQSERLTAKRIQIGKSELTEAGLAALAESPLFARAEEVSLSLSGPHAHALRRRAQELCGDKLKVW